MAALSGKSGRVYAAPLVIDDGEDTWAETVVGGVALSTVTGKVGNAARATTTGIGATTLLMSEAITKDLTAYDAVVGYFRASVSTSTGDLHLQLDDTASCASPIEDLSIPALSANTWRLCCMRLATPASLGSIISVGLYQNTDLADGTFDVDDVYAVAEVDGIKSWTVNYKQSVGNSTDFQSDGVTEYTPTITDWSGSFSGDKDGAPLAMGSAVYAAFGESKTSTQNWVGQIIITGVTPKTAYDGLVTYDYTFVGTGHLEVPTT